MDIAGLVKQSQDGDTQAFGQLYDIFADRLFRYIRLKIPARHEAEDILQEVFLKAWKGIGTLSPERLNLNAWLYTVASNTINDHFRKSYRSPATAELNENLDAPADDSPARETSDAYDAAIIKKAMAALPVQYRQILELRFVQDFTLEETARILSRTNVAIRVLQHRALKRLKSHLKKTHAVEY